MSTLKFNLQILLVTLVLVHAYGQKASEQSYEFEIEVFNSSKYKKNHYAKFQGIILSKGKNTYQFGDKFLTLSIDNEDYLKLFLTGIFNPDVIFGPTTTIRQTELDSMSQNQKALYNLVRNDRLSICCFRELEKLNPNPQTKRFVFWLFRTGISNPTEYYIEFWNEKAIKNTSIQDFIQGARMTFFHQGGIII
jgi:hypothetical protein